MKKNLIIALTFFMALGQIHAQDSKSMITVVGEGKVKVVPDQVSISISVESNGTKAADVKKENDSKVDAVLKYIKKMGIAKEDFQTTRVSLNDQYDYEKKKHNYFAVQSIQILIKDLGMYDQLMAGLVESGTNRIGNINFQSSKIESHKSQARKLAIQNAKAKAQDYVDALGNLKLHYAHTIVDNSQDNYPQPRYEMMAMKMADVAGNETLAPGEIEVTANVSVSFLLEYKP
ncbi:SIMPL domain-containing protein [Flavobacterium sp. SM2513]|uniref:SIMPL domain-containing protein n=1 Tax=Flavobacterium sp. SM2513 TaxID=3424766 RepID=UPI003D7F4BE4